MAPNGNGTHHETVCMLTGGTPSITSSPESAVSSSVILGYQFAVSARPVAEFNEPS